MISKLTWPVITGLSTLGILGTGFSLAQTNEFEVRGNIELQARVFSEDPLFEIQPGSNLSAAAEPEFFWSWNGGNDSFEFVPFARVDQHDDERTHSDIREFSWIHVGDDWESRIGVRRVFWGVTEFQHLVDIINQSDTVEDVDNEDKLGQPMLNLSLVKDYGIFDFYVLPYFRERTFNGAEGRPAIPFINPDLAVFEHQDEENHIDFAIRWAHSIGDYDIGLSVFDGTSRDPLIIPQPGVIPIVGIPLPLVPYYQQITQYGFDMQATIDDMLWKVEAIFNQNNQEDFAALQAGFEFSQYGVFESNADLGWLMEYGWDERGTEATGINQNDIFFGSRLAFNDAESSDLLMGVSYDLDYQSHSFLLEASRRFGDSLKVSLDIRLFFADEASDPIFLFRQDDHLQLTAQYYY